MDDRIALAEAVMRQAHDLRTECGSRGGVFRLRRDVIAALRCCAWRMLNPALALSVVEQHHLLGLVVEERDAMPGVPAIELASITGTH